MIFKNQSPENHENPFVLLLNHLVPSVDISARIAKILILNNLEGIIQKISYERRDYKSVDEKRYVPKKTKKENSGTKILKQTL